MSEVDRVKFDSENKEAVNEILEWVKEWVELMRTAGLSHEQITYIVKREMLDAMIAKSARGRVPARYLPVCGAPAM